MKRAALFFILGVLGLAVVISLNLSVSAYALGIMDGVNAAHGTGQPTQLFGGDGIITAITNTLLFIAGALAVVMIIFGGLRYVTSAGNPASVTAAKNTILYAIVGLIISFLAFAIINFVLGALAPGSQIPPTNM